MKHGEIITVTLVPGETLAITTDVSATASVIRLPDTPGGASPGIIYAVPASTTKRIGPFGIQTRYSITASNGTVTYSTGRIESGQNSTGSIIKIATTNGTTPVLVFDAAGAPAAYTIKSIEVIALDPTAGNIIAKNAGSTVTTIAKGTTAGVPTGMSSLSNTAIAAGASLTVESSSAGNATIIIILDPA